jgi:hypothetical protein
MRNDNSPSSTFILVGYLHCNVIYFSLETSASLQSHGTLYKVAQMYHNGP